MWRRKWIMIKLLILLAVLFLLLCSVGVGWWFVCPCLFVCFVFLAVAGCFCSWKREKSPFRNLSNKNGGKMTWPCKELPKSKIFVNNKCNGWKMSGLKTLLLHKNRSQLSHHSSSFIHSFSPHLIISSSLLTADPHFTAHCFGLTSHHQYSSRQASRFFIFYH